MRPASTLRGSPSLAPVTAPRHVPACPRCGGRLVQLEEPTCLPCGWADYSLPGLTLTGPPCGICREPLKGDRLRYCSTACRTVAHNRRKAQANRHRVRLGRCVRCGEPADATYCPRHQSIVRAVQLDWRARRRASGCCLKCADPKVTAIHCERHRQEHNASIRAARQSRIAAGLCRHCGEPVVTGSFCDLHRQHNARAS